MCAGQVCPSLHFGSEYEAPELGVADVVVVFAVVAANVWENHVSQIHAREAGLQMGTWRITLLIRGLSAIKILHTLLLIACGSASLCLSYFRWT